MLAHVSTLLQMLQGEPKTAKDPETIRNLENLGKLVQVNRPQQSLQFLHHGPVRTPALQISQCS